MSAPGVILTDRDRRLLAYFALARLLTADQVQQLLGGDLSPQVTARRLRRLSEESPPQRSHPNAGPYLERHELRSDPGAARHVWSLTEAGWLEAKRVEADWLASSSHRSPLLPDSMQPATRDLGQQFVKHTILLNQVLVDLVSQRGAAATPLPELPFRWIPEAKDQLGFKLYDKRTGLVVPTAVKPDAILEAPGVKRRFFLEAETGSHSITTRAPFGFHAGAITRKLQRYAAYFTGLVEKGLPATWYSRAFPDQLFPELLILVHSTSRKERVGWVTSRRLAKMPEPRPFAVRVLTFEEAARAIAAVMENKLVPRSRLITIPESTATGIRDGYNTLVSSFNAVLAAVAAHNAKHPAARVALPPVPQNTIAQLATIIRSDLLSQSAPRWAAHLVDEDAPSKRSA
jgi:hypothetical protein